MVDILDMCKDCKGIVRNYLLPSKDECKKNFDKCIEEFNRYSIKQWLYDERWFHKPKFDHLQDGTYTVSKCANPSCELKPHFRIPTRYQCGYIYDIKQYKCRCTDMHDYYCVINHTHLCAKHYLHSIKRLKPYL